MRHHVLPPVWRLAPRRLLHDPLGLGLVVAVFTMVALSSSAGPLYVEAASDASLRLVLASVPTGAAPKERPVVRLSGGVDPSSRQWSDLVAALGDVPGTAPARVTAQSVSTELHSRIFYDPVGPVVTGNDGSPGAPVRLFGVDDPADRLVVVSRMPGAARGVWLPEPVAVSTGARPGDTVTVHLSGLPDTPTASTTVLGVYAVEPDGRTPQQPPGQRWWADLSSEEYPSDAQRPTLRAHLVVADLATTTALGGEIDDQLLWSAQSSLALPRDRLSELHRTATAVATLRRALAARSDLTSGPVALRPALASGIEALDRRAAELSSAAERGAIVISRLGVVVALALVAAAAASTMARRRREVRLTAGVGRRPVSAGLLHVVELLPPAALGGVLGWLGARALVTAAVGSSAPSQAVLLTAALWCAGSLVAALVVAGVVAGVATRVETRRLEGRPDLHVPWVVVLVVAAASATAGLVTRPPSDGDELGPLDLLVPPLVFAALAAVGSRLFFAALRRTGTSARRPSARTVAPWLAGRRLRSPDRGREATTTIAATGLAVLVFSLASLSSLHQTVDDRVAVEVGADTVHRVGSSWRLDPAAPVQAVEPEDGTPLPVADVPVARTPALPSGQAMVWRTRTTVASSDESVQLLVVDPLRISEAASWGSDEGPVAAGLSALPALAAQDAEAAAATHRDGVSRGVPGLLVGDVGALGLEAGSAVTVDTLNLPVRVVVLGVLSAFPGAGTGQPTLVVAADSFFASQLNDDPRLRPAPGTPRNRPMEFQADLWSATPDAATRTLTAAGVAPELVGTLDQARTTPAYVATAQARRYQVALGLVFGALGLSAVAVAAVRLARRSPVADRMLAWAGAGQRAPSRARFLEVAAVVALTAGVSTVALLALHPLAATLLEPGDGRTPAAALTVSGSALAAGACWLVLTLFVSVVGMHLAATSQSAVEVLRGDD